MGKLWRKLLTPETLARGWHLARNDARQDFSEDLYSVDVYGLDLQLHVGETISRLATNTYQPRPLFRTQVPKGALAFRPGAVVPIQDRVVFSAIALLLAGELDKKLPDAVYSWRLKDPIPKSGSIFKNSDITDLPFLKKSTIRREVDPFEGWYELWPEFDEQTRRLYQEQDYRFLATSDIAAYFENIQLPILRDALLQHVPRETELVNLLCNFLESWCERTRDGRPHHRGIPQGNFVSSLLGNFFLLPVDEALLDFGANNDIRYFRYMDDVRIFAKDREAARRAVFLMTRHLRALHLNVQTAKTRIYDEDRSEISDLLIDRRVDQLSDEIDAIQSDLASGAKPQQILAARTSTLERVARDQPPGRQKILGARTPLEGLTTRAFNRWMTAHHILGSSVYVRRLLDEIARNADSRLTRKLMRAARTFPRNRMIEPAVLKMIMDQKIIFPHQEAECLRALRYLSSISSATENHCWERLTDSKGDRYLRMEAAYLLARVPNADSRLRAIAKLLRAEADPYVQVALAMILVQRPKENSETVRYLVFHPNEKVRDIGKLFRMMKNDRSHAVAALRHTFDTQIPWVVCDRMSLVHLAALSEHKNIRQVLLDSIRGPRVDHPIVGVRDTLKKLYTRTRKWNEST